MEGRSCGAGRALIGQPEGLEACPVRIRRSSHVRFFLLAFFTVTSLLFTSQSLVAAQATNGTAGNGSTLPNIQVQNFDVQKQTVTVIAGESHQPVTVAKGSNLDAWTLMAVIAAPEGNLAVFEELADRKGSIIYV